MHPRTRTRLAAGFLALFGLVVLAPARAATDPVKEVAVTFTVVNSNATNVLCPSDAQAYEIKGHLVGPRSKLAGKPSEAVTMYVHSIGWGEFYWHFTADPSVDYATRMARLGHVSLVYDQLGYGASGRPPGLQSCYGSEADTIHQIVTALRSGAYTVDTGGATTSFTKVALASHFAGGFMTEPAAYSFGDVDAMIITGFADTPTLFSPTILAATSAVLAHCALGGDASDGDSGPKGYHFTPLTEDGFRKFFYNARPGVVDQAVGLRHRGPCGEPMSAVTTLGIDKLNLSKITVPVLLVYGDHDVVYTNPALAGRGQVAMLTGSTDVTLKVMKDSGSALTLGKTAGDFRTLVSDWLAHRGF